MPNPLGFEQEYAFPWQFRDSLVETETGYYGHQVQPSRESQMKPQCRSPIVDECDREFVNCCDEYDRFKKALFLGEHVVAERPVGYKPKKEYFGSGSGDDKKLMCWVLFIAAIVFVWMYLKMK